MVFISRSSKGYLGDDQRGTRTRNPKDWSRLVEVLGRKEHVLGNGGGGKRRHKTPKILTRCSWGIFGGEKTSSREKKKPCGKAGTRSAEWERRRGVFSAAKSPRVYRVLLGGRRKKGSAVGG